MCACTMTHMWRLDGNLRELFLSSRHVGSGHLVWVVRLVASTFTLSSLLLKSIYLHVGVGIIHTTMWRSEDKLKEPVQGLTSGH